MSKIYSHENFEHIYVLEVGYPVFRITVKDNTDLPDRKLSLTSDEANRMINTLVDNGWKEVSYA